ncbi:uncharacterized protein FIBRA_07019 [Fibroporia radiculosa]|uniref:N-end rule aminoacyl transferase C-terminal domain-containing protein n=1 Tax=Fibroporia radiculosa TaxID=599839 RepID=J4IBK6_9APHY|nr:uncharacterized protein FIBRA_07019 [Fibroporia radiculosa]CCM04826.1 predicted protein [Fibroporia radiculosa]
MLISWNRFILYGDDVDDKDVRKVLKSSKTASFSLVEEIHASEHEFLPSGFAAQHKFQVSLEPSSFTDEKFALYESYQRQIHLDEDNTRHGFKRFLVETPLHREAIKYARIRPVHLPLEYGSYHQMYRLDGELIAMGVIDILPECVSSVYFMYEKKWERFSLGKLSAFRESALANEMHKAGVVNVKSLYMGMVVTVISFKF